jgi:hypothetical protein
VQFRVVLERRGVPRFGEQQLPGNERRDRDDGPPLAKAKLINKYNK